MVAFVALASLVMQSPYGPQQETAATGIGALLLAANLVIARAAGDYFAERREREPAAPHLVAVGGGAVLPRVPRRSCSGPGDSDEPWA